jgi:WD40 repeat protein
LKRIVAIKRIKTASSSSHLSGCISDTVTEILRTRSHPNIINLLDYFVEGRDHCLVMEYIPDAKSLRSLANEYGRKRSDGLPVLTESEIVLLALTLVDSLCYLHSLETSRPSNFHGELKPEKILIARSSIVDETGHETALLLSTTFKLLTLSSSLVSYDSAVTNQGCKDVDYSAPEILLSRDPTRHSHASSCKTDMWSFAATLLNLSTSFKIYEQESNTLERFRNRLWSFDTDVLSKFSTSQRSLWEQQPVLIQDIICSCLLLDSEERFTAPQLRDMPAFQVLSSLFTVAKGDIQCLQTENQRLRGLLRKYETNTNGFDSENSGKYETLSYRKIDTEEVTTIPNEKDDDCDSMKSNYSSETEEEVRVIYSRKEPSFNSAGIGNLSNRNVLSTQANGTSQVQSNSSFYLDIRKSHSSEISPRNYPEIDFNRVDRPSDMDIARSLHRMGSIRGSLGSIANIKGLSSGVLEEQKPDSASSVAVMRGKPSVAAAMGMNADPLADKLLISKRVLQGHSHYIACVAVLPDDRIVSGSYDNTIKVWNSTTGACELTLFGHSSYVYCLAVLPDGRLVSGSWDTTLKIWNMTTGECEQTLSGHNSFVCWVVYLPDSKRIVSGDHKKSVRVWQCDEHGSSFQFDRPATIPFSQCVAMLPNGNAILAQGTNSVAARFVGLSLNESSDPIPNRRPSRSEDSSGPQMTPNEAIASTERNNVTIASSGVSSRDGGADNSESTYINSYKNVDGNSKGSLLPASSYSRMRNDTSSSGGSKPQQVVYTYRLYGSNCGTSKCTFEGHLRPIAAAVQLGINFVTVSSDRTARVWDSQSGACLAILSGHTGDVNSAAISPNGYVVTSSNDNSIQVWDTTRYAEVKRPLPYAFRHNAELFAEFTLQGHQHFVSCVAVLSDGRIVSGSFDKTLIIWSGLEEILTMPKENMFKDSFCLNLSEDSASADMDDVPVISSIVRKRSSFDI